MPITFQERTLPNGLTIVAEVDPSAHSAAAGFFVKTGARDESTPLMGVSHFLEHMMFKGTADLTAEDINRGFDAIGASNNAYTSSEITCFYAHTLPETLPTGLDLLSRMMRPALRQADFDTEKGVILEEIAMYKDNPFWVLYEASVEKHFGAHPMSHRVLGTSESITALQRDSMAGYFENRYSADNTVVALAGKVDFDLACDQVQALCGSWKPTRVGRDTKAPKVGGGTFELRDAKVSRGYVLGLAPAPSLEDDRRYAASLLAQVLGTPDNSLLHWALIETGLAEEAQAAYDPHDGCGDYFVFASGDPERLDEIWEVTTREAGRLMDAVTLDDLVRLRNKIATAATLGAERPGDRMQRLGRLYAAFRRYMPLEEELAKIDAVTLDDLRATHDAFPIKPVTVGRLLPA